MKVNFPQKETEKENHVYQLYVDDIFIDSLQQQLEKACPDDYQLSDIRDTIEKAGQKLHRLDGGDILQRIYLLAYFTAQEITRTQYQKIIDELCEKQEEILSELNNRKIVEILDPPKKQLKITKARKIKRTV